MAVPLETEYQTLEDRLTSPERTTVTDAFPPPSDTVIVADAIWTTATWPRNPAATGTVRLRVWALSAAVV